MKFEGKQINIPVKGIMRAGADNLCADGAMNEVIGMEYKDGSWLPYKEKETIYHVGYLNSSYVFTNIIANKVYIHKTTDGSQHCVFISDSKELWYEYKRYTTPQHLIYVKKLTDNVKDVTFMGNTICLVTDSGQEYYIWKGDAQNPDNSTYERYDIVGSARLKLRVTAGMTKKYQPNGVTQYPVYGMCYVNKINGEYVDSNDLVELPVDTERQMVLGGLTAAKGSVRDNGGLTGYVLACAAYRLRNGDLVQASAPVLLGRPCQRYGGQSDGYFEAKAVEGGATEASETFSISNPSGTSHDIKLANGTTGDGITSDYSIFIIPRHDDWLEDDHLVNNAYTKEGEHYIYLGPSSTSLRAAIGGTEGQLFAIDEEAQGDFYTGVPPEWRMGYFGRPHVPTLMTTKMRLHVIKSGGTVPLKKYEYMFTSFAASNKLQFQVSAKDIDVDNDMISSVCIFISPEISPFEIPEKIADFGKGVYDSNPSALQIGEYADGIYTRTLTESSYQARYRSEEDIVKDIRDIKSLYLVKEIPVSELEVSNDWEDVDLEGLLGDTLLTREQLPLTAFDHTKTYPEHIDAYNYRAHVYNYMQELFAGYDLPSFNYYGGDRQISGGTINGRGSWEVFVEFKDEGGNSKMVTHHEGTWVTGLLQSQSPFICYPAKNATSMTIKMYEVLLNEFEHQTPGSQITLTGRVYTKTIPLENHPNLGISYYIDPELKPIMPSGAAGDLPSSLPTDSPSNITRPALNGMKVSDTAFPSIYPTAQTYRIGNGEIIGMARLTIPLSQDNFGRYQLIIFCTDGIYSMDIDSSGVGAYSSTAYVSPEVCVNPKTICEIGGAVFFAGEKGLMVLTGNNSVQEFIPELNGKPRFLPAETTSKEANGIYTKIIENAYIMGSDDDIVSREDFIDYIKNSETHLSYINIKHKLLAFNEDYEFAYYIDITTHHTTKLRMKIFGEDGNNVGKIFWSRLASATDYSYRQHLFTYQSQEYKETGDYGEITVPSLVVSRPIKVQQDDKNSYRVVLTGYFRGLKRESAGVDRDTWAELVVMGSLDADHWRVIGVKEKKLVDGFHNLGCLTERGSWKYLMFIFAGQLTADSHIDSIDITIEGRYNNKKR